MIKAIIFDCFGVLITDAFALMIQDLQTRKPGKAKELLDAVQAVNRGIISRQEFTEQAAGLLGMSPQEYRNKLDNGEVKNRPLFAYIEELHKTYKTAVLSNVSHEGFWRRFTHDEVAPYFDTIVLSGETGFIKPDPEAYEITADKLGVRVDECVMIDDQAAYIEAAQEVGMQGMLYATLQELQTGLNQLIARS